jgi:hypothetical protein
MKFTPEGQRVFREKKNVWATKNDFCWKVSMVGKRR